MKKAGKIALGVVGVLVVAGIAVTAWQWNNVKAAVYLMTMDQETLTTKLDENQKVLNDAMEEYQITPYEFTQEQIDALASGELDPEALAAQLLAEEDGQTAAPSVSAAPETDNSGESSASPSTGGSAATTPPAPSQSAQAEPYAAEKAQVRELITTMYVLRATYVGKLEAIVQEAIDEYVAGDHTPENRQKVVYSKVEELTALEKECDAKVADVVSRMRTLLKDMGQDDTLAKEVEQTYQEEKSLKKAYYVSEFKNG